MFVHVDAVEVRIWGRRVGAVALDPRLQFYAFEYDPAFVRTGIELAPLTMPLSRARDPFIFPELPEATFARLPALVADALPDDFGNALIDAWMATRGVSPAEVTPLDRLAYMGTRGTGALEFRPARGPERPSSTALDLAELVETARRAVRGDLVTDAHASAALAHILQVGTSAGGARAKAAIAWHPTTGEIRAGQFDVPDGFEHWLLKFDGMGADARLGPGAHYGRVEYAYALMAVAAGIRMSPCRLLEESGRAHFMTKRFDRDGNVKHHLQTLCAIAHLDYRQRATHDVSEWLSVLERLGLGYELKEEALRRTIFNVMARNCDDHTKNVSFLRRQDGAWELAPAYDVTHAYNPKGAWTYQHLTSVNGKFARITRRDILDVADRFAIGTAPRVLEEVGAAVRRWRTFAKRAGLPAKEIERIKKDHQLL